MKSFSCVNLSKLSLNRAGFTSTALVVALLVSIVPQQPGVASELETSASLRFTPTQQLAKSRPLAATVLASLKVKGRAPKTGYAREKFSSGWANISTCSSGGVVDARNYILVRDLTRKTFRDGPGCVVASGLLKDPYTGASIRFVKGLVTSLAVQIDHIVAVSDAWQKGAQKLSSSKRFAFYNDPNNLIAVDGPTNQAKSDSDAASWLPPQKSIRCWYVSQQILVKSRYQLWVTAAERDAMARVLSGCPKYRLASPQITLNFVQKR